MAISRKFLLHFALERKGGILQKKKKIEKKKKEKEKKSLDYIVVDFYWICRRLDAPIT
jgi:hypothetical protein